VNSVDKRYDITIGKMFYGSCQEIYSLTFVFYMLLCGFAHGFGDIIIGMVVWCRLQWNPKCAACSIIN
jgi:hypothetical protein